MPNLKHFLSIGKLFKQCCYLTIRKDLITASGSETKKPENFFDETKTIKKQNEQNEHRHLKSYVHTCNVEILKFLMLNL